MITSILKIIPLDEKRREVLDTLLFVKGPAEADPGCLSCSIYEEHDEAHGLVYIEEWLSLSALERHIRSVNYSRLLEAIELSAVLPEIRSHETGETWGLELIERVRNSH